MFFWQEWANKPNLSFACHLSLCSPTVVFRFESKTFRLNCDHLKVQPRAHDVAINSTVEYLPCFSSFGVYIVNFRSQHVACSIFKRYYAKRWHGCQVSMNFGKSKNNFIVFLSFDGHLFQLFPSMILLFLPNNYFFKIICIP